jgi:hypothetical protein
LKTIEAEERYAAPDEQRVLALYAGWGGIPQAFDDQNADWRREHSELKELLTEKEYAPGADVHAERALHLRRSDRGHICGSGTLECFFNKLKRFRRVATRYDNIFDDDFHADAVFNRVAQQEFLKVNVA